MNEWWCCLISFLNNYLLVRKLLVLITEEKNIFRQDYFHLNKHPSSLEHLDCLLIPIFNISLILTIPWLLSLSMLIFSTAQFQFRERASVPKQTHSTWKQTFSVAPKHSVHESISSPLSLSFWLSFLYKARINPFASMENHSWCAERQCGTDSGSGDRDMVVGWWRRHTCCDRAHGFHVCQQKPKTTQANAEY